MDSEIAENIELEAIFDANRSSLSDTLCALFDYRSIKYPRDFAAKTGLYDALFNKIKQGKTTTMTKETLMAIAVGLRLNAHATTRLMECSGVHLNRNVKPDSIYLLMLERFPGITIETANAVLHGHSLPLLGSKSRTV